jgi:transposase
MAQEALPTAPPKKEYSPHKRTRIIVSLEAGLTPKEVAAREGIPVGSIRGIRSRYKKQTSAKSLPRSGRPPLLGERDKRHLLRLITENPTVTYKELLAHTGLTCSTVTLKRYLKANGVEHKPLARVLWARK